MRLRSENRKLRRQLEEGESKELEELRKQIEKIKNSAFRIRDSFTMVYNEILENRQASKMQRVFRLGHEMKKFLEENFGV
jgi:hypothetical protein